MKASIVGILAVTGLAAIANAQIAIVPSAVPFIDIGTTGTSIGAISDDSETTVTGHGWIGNGLLAGGMAFRVGNNGGLIWGNSAADTFTGGTDVGYYNAGPNHTGATSIASMAASNTGDSGNGGGVRQFLAVLWDDNFPSSTAVPPSNIRWQVIGNDLIVQWTNEDHFAAQGAGFVTYEMIAHGGVAIGSGQSLVDFVYQDTLYQASQYQNDGGSAAIGYKNWGLNANANDVEYGIGGGGTSSTSDPAFGDASMRPKVGGWAAAADTTLTHSVSIIPAPGAMALLGLGGLLAGRRRR